MGKSQFSSSPNWSNTTKLVVGLSFVALITLLLISFRQILGPILLAFIIAYVVTPLARVLKEKLRISWQFAVTLIYLVMLLLFVAMLTGSGLFIITQVQNLIRFLQNTLTDLPTYIQQYSHQVVSIGPFEINLSTIDLSSLSSQILSMTQSILSQLGTVLTNIVSGAASTIGWAFFIILISYFILAETGGRNEALINIQIPGYQEDLVRIGKELSNIWNSFLRNQLILQGIAIIIYAIFLGMMGVHYYYGLAVLAGVTRFVPYIGAFVMWSTNGLVSYFQGTTIFGMQPLPYAILIMAASILIDTMIDNVLYYRLMGTALKAHPAAVMVAAIIALNWIGFIGVILAAPVLATFQLFGSYTLRKMFDLDPWEGLQETPPPPVINFRRMLADLRGKIQKLLPNKPTDKQA